MYQEHEKYHQISLEGVRHHGHTLSRVTLVIEHMRRREAAVPRRMLQLLTPMLREVQAGRQAGLALALE